MPLGLPYPRKELDEGKVVIDVSCRLGKCAGGITCH